MLQLQRVLTHSWCTAVAAMFEPLVAPTADAPKISVKPGSYEEVVVHPLVLLSIVDHFKRVEEVRQEHQP